MPGAPAHLTGGGNSLISAYSRGAILCFRCLWSTLSIGSAGSILSISGRGALRGRPVLRAGAVRR